MGAASLFGNSGDLQRLHRIIAHLAFAGASITAAVLGLVGWFSSDPTIGVQGLPPAFVAVAVGASMGARKHNAAFTLGVAACSVIVAVPIIGTPSTIVGASTGVVLILVFGVLFVSKQGIWYIVAAGTLVAATPLFWNRAMIAETLVTSFVMTLSFTVGAVSLLLVRQAAAAANTKYRIAFHEAPSALVELDWTEAYASTQMIAASDENVLRFALADNATVAAILGTVRVVRANAAMARLLGMDEATELSGSISGRFVLEEFREAWTENIVSVWSGEEHFNNEFHVTRHGSKRWVGVRSRMREDGSGSKVALVTMTDITDSKLLNQRLEETIAAKDDFIASVSHEIRTPLTAVVGLSGELRGDDQLDDEERNELLDIVHRQATEMAYIIEDLLVGARSDIGTVSTMKDAIGLRRLIEQLLAELRTNIPVDIALSLVAIGDGVRIRQIVRNLVVNTERYGGKERRILGYAMDDTVVIEVRDDGSPLPEEARVRVFGAYESAHNTNGTTAAMGLGLNVSRTLANLMGGDLSYDHDGETVFRLTLPAADSGVRVERRSVSRSGETPDHSDVA